MYEPQLEAINLFCDLAMPDISQHLKDHLSLLINNEKDHQVILNIEDSILNLKFLSKIVSFGIPSIDPKIEFTPYPFSGLPRKRCSKMHKIQDICHFAETVCSAISSVTGIPQDGGLPPVMKYISLNAIFIA